MQVLLDVEIVDRFKKNELICFILHCYICLNYPPGFVLILKVMAYLLLPWSKPILSDMVAYSVLFWEENFLWICLRDALVHRKTAVKSWTVLGKYVPHS